MRDPQTLAERTKPGKANWLITMGVCTHLGCVPLGAGEGENRGEFGGYFCPCHGSQYSRVGEKKGGPAPRGMDHFLATVSAGGDVVIDTGVVYTGVPIGTNTTGQEAEGPHCVGGGHE